MNRVDELESLIKRHAELYYNDEPQCSDAHFDRLIDELRKASPNSPVLAKVGAKPASNTVWKEVLHEIPMGSQLKINTIPEFLDWARSIKCDEFCWSEKLDGSSLAIKHTLEENAGAIAYSLLCGYSRGDGTTGSDISPNVGKMTVLLEPVFEPLRRSSGEFWTRGEVIMKKATFDAKYKGVTKNPRNAAAGIARRLDGVGCEDLGVVMYDVTGVEFATEYEKFTWLEACGFFVPAYGVVKVDELAVLYQRYRDGDRAACPFEIDGLIIAVNSIVAQKALGVVDGRPKGQRALKFPAEEKETRINSVTWQTGRTGRITPVAEIEPTDLGGVTISRVMLNNLDLIEERGYGIGGRVMLRRANDVIPELGEVLSHGPHAITPPTHCPSCAQPTSVDGPFLVCTNKACSAQVLAHLLNFLRVLNVKGFGLATIEYLVNKGVLNSSADFYALRSNDFESDVMGIKLTAEFQSKAKTMTLPVFIDSLGISGIGQHFAELAMTKFSADEIVALNTWTPSYATSLCKGLIEIPGIGPELAQAYISGRQEKGELIEALLNYVTITEPVVVQATGTKCQGMVVCFTGFRDSTLEARVTDQGGVVASGMNKQVTHVIAKDANGSSSKLVKARAAGLKVWSREELEQGLE